MGTTAGSVVAGGDVTAGDDLTVTDDASVGGDLAVTGDASVGDDLTVTDSVTAAKAFVGEAAGYVDSYTSLTIDGANPPTAWAIRLYDHTTGSFTTGSMINGTLTWA